MAGAFEVVAYSRCRKRGYLKIADATAAARHEDSDPRQFFGAGI